MISDRGLKDLRTNVSGWEGRLHLTYKRWQWNPMSSCFVIPVQDLKLRQDTSESRHRLLAESTTVPRLTCTPTTSCLWLSECHLTKKKIKHGPLHFTARLYGQFRTIWTWLHVCGMHRSKIHTMHSSPFQHLAVKTSGREGHEVSKTNKNKQKQEEKKTYKVQGSQSRFTHCVI